MDETKKLKMAIIAGAAHAMKYKEKHSSSSEQEVLRYVSKEMDSILQEIDEKF